MPVMTVLPAGRSFEVAPDTTILAALLAAGENMKSKCGGEAKCGACHVFIHDGRKTVSKMQRAENERLDSIVGVGSKSRLACQTRIGAENVSVELLGFGSGL